MGMTALSSCLSSISETFPLFDSSEIQLIATLPDVFIVITTLLFGKIIKHISLKRCFVVSCTLFLITGIGGFFLNSNINLLYLWSITLGLAIGLLMPSVTTWISWYTNGIEREKAIGYQNAAVSLGGIMIAIIVSRISISGFKYSYLIFLIIFFCLIGFLKYMKTDTLIEEEKQCRYDKETIKATIILSVFVFLFFSLYNGISVNLSQYVVEVKLKESMGGIAIAMMLLGSFLMATLYDKLSKIHFINLLSFGMILLSSGLLITLTIRNNVGLLIGQLISGGSLSIVMSSCISYLLNLGNGDNSYPVSIMLAISDGGGFFSAFYILLSTIVFNNSNSSACLLMIFVLSVSLLVILRLINILKNNKY